MKHEPSILKPSKEGPTGATHLIITGVGQILGGFIVAIFVSMLITSFFPTSPLLGP